MTQLPQPLPFSHYAANLRQLQQLSIQLLPGRIGEPAAILYVAEAPIALAFAQSQGRTFSWNPGLARSFAKRVKSQTITLYKVLVHWAALVRGDDLYNRTVQDRKQLDAWLRTRDDELIQLRESFLHAESGALECDAPYFGKIFPQLADRRSALGEIERMFKIFYRQAADMPPHVATFGQLPAIHQLLRLILNQQQGLETPKLSPELRLQAIECIASSSIVRERLEPWMADHGLLLDITWPEIEHAVARRRAHLELELREIGPLFWPGHSQGASRKVI